MIHNSPSSRSVHVERESARSRSGFLGAIFGGISRKKGADKENKQKPDPKRPSTTSLEKSRRPDGASKKSRASTPDDALYAFVMAKHDRLGRWSTAQQLPDELFVNIVDFALDPALTVKKVFRDAPKLINLVTNNSHRTLLQRVSTVYPYSLNVSVYVHILITVIAFLSTPACKRCHH